MNTPHTEHSAHSDSTQNESWLAKIDNKVLLPTFNWMYNHPRKAALSALAVLVVLVAIFSSITFDAGKFLKVLVAMSYAIVLLAIFAGGISGFIVDRRIKKQVRIESAQQGEGYPFSDEVISSEEQGNHAAHSSGARLSAVAGSMSYTQQSPQDVSVSKNYEPLPREVDDATVYLGEQPRSSQVSQSDFSNGSMKFDEVRQQIKRHRSESE